MEHWEASSISSVSDALVIDTRSNSLSSLEDVNGKQQNVESVITETVDYMDSTECGINLIMAPTGAVDIQIIENLPSETDNSVDRCFVSLICLCLTVKKLQKRGRAWCAESNIL